MVRDFYYLTMKPTTLSDHDHKMILKMISAIFSYYELSYVKLIKSFSTFKSRKLGIMKAKSMTCYILKEYTDYSLNEIGHYLNLSYSNVHVHWKNRKEETELGVNKELLYQTEDLLRIVKDIYDKKDPKPVEKELITLDLNRLPNESLVELKKILHTINADLDIEYLDLDRAISRIDRKLTLK